MISFATTLQRAFASRLPLLLAVLGIGLLGISMPASAQPDDAPALVDADRPIESMYAESIGLEGAGKIDAALEMALAILAREDNARIRMRLGWLYHLIGNYEHSLLQYRRALLSSGKSDEAKLGVMLALVNLGRWRNAKTVGEDILAQSPENIWAHRYMALALYMLADYEGSLIHYAFAYENQPDDPLITLGYGLALVQAGQIERGRKFCKDVEDAFPGDERLAYCLNGKAPEWYFNAQAQATGGFYTDAWDTREFAGAFLGFTALSPKGLGFSLDFSFSYNFQRYTIEDFNQYAPGGGIFYMQQQLLVWLHYQAMFGNDGAQGTGHVIDLHTKYIWPINVGFGGDLAIGVYDGFQTLQLAPELSYAFNKSIELYLMGMLQSRFGDIDRAIVQERIPSDRTLRGSGEIGIRFHSRPIGLDLSGYYGSRWFTAENKGVLVWNGDDNLVAGARLTLSLFPEAVVTGILGMRYDYADRQFGLAHRFHILGFTAGLQAQF